MDTLVRIYSFKDLMHRLTSPAWGVIEHNGLLIFMPNIYRDGRSRK